MPPTPAWRPHLPGAGAQLLEAGEGVDGASAFPLLPAHSQLLQAPQLLHLGLQLLHLRLQALDGLCEPGGRGARGRDFNRTGPALPTAGLEGLGDGDRWAALTPAAGC